MKPKPKKMRKLSDEQNIELRIAQNKLARGKWTFKEYSEHLSEYVYAL